MVKFEIVAAAPIALTVQNRVVCDVTEYRFTTEQFGKVISWRGSVSDEYFSILFVKGLLEVSLAEREMQLGNASVHYALTERAFNVSPDPIQAANQYGITEINDDVERMTFVDIMVALNWKYAPNVKIYHDVLGD